MNKNFNISGSVLFFTLSLFSLSFSQENPQPNHNLSSSIRWKTDIQPIDNALEKVLQLRGVYFNWDEGHGGQRDIGMVAEEVGKIFPEIVNYENGGRYASDMDYAKLTAALVEALKLQQKQIDKLQKQIDNLKHEISAVSKEW